MASPYDALLEPPKSEYDALLEPESSPYDALLDTEVPRGTTTEPKNYGPAAAVRTEMDWANKPLLTLPRAEQQQGPIDQISAGIANAGADLAEGLSTPLNVAMAPLAATKTLGRVVAGIFSGQMLSHVPESIQAADRETTLQGRTRGALGVLSNLFLGIGAGVHATGLRAKLKPVLEPEGLAPDAAIPEPVRPVKAPKVEPVAEPPLRPNEAIQKTVGRNGEAAPASETIRGSNEPLAPAPESPVVETPVRAANDAAASAVKPETVVEPISPANAQLSTANAASAEATQATTIREVPPVRAAPEIVTKAPEHLRIDSEVARLLETPEAQTGPQMRGPREAPEGGALGFKGGTTPKVAPKGVSARGDTEFLRIEPGWKRITKGLEREGAADVIGHSKNKVGQMLSKATRKHVDIEQELFGQLSNELQQTVRSIGKDAPAAFDEVATYFAAKENGRALPTLTPPAQKLVTAWENIAEQTGNISAANNVQVFDPTTGKHRSMHIMGRDYVPRTLRSEVQQVMQNPDRNPALWNALVDDFAKSRKITDIEAAAELRAESGHFAANDYMSNLERARTGKLPESFYEYDLRNIASEYIPSFSERMAQIVAYGQRLGPREAPLRPNLWDVARKEAADTYTQNWLTSAEDQAINLKTKGASGTGMARAQTLASGLLLSNPATTVVRNLTTGLVATPELLGVRRAFGGLIETVRNRQTRMDAKEIGAVRDDMGNFLHVDRLGDSLVDDAIRVIVDKGLKYSGYTGSEVFVRSHAAVTASRFAKDAVADLAKNPASMRSKEALGLFKRMGADAEKIAAESADWKNGPETRKFIRTVIHDTQGGYRFDQVPLWANSNMGRFFYQYGRWGTQRSRNIWKNAIQPALGEEVQWKGKTMTRRDVRPLLKMATGSVLLGEAFAGIAQVLFGRDRKDASFAEISAAWNQDEKKAVGLALERTVNDIIMAGTLGIWSQPIDWAKGLKDQSRLKNPTEPPGLASVKALMDLGQAAIDQGTITRRDLLDFAGSAAPGLKQASDVARNVIDEPIYEAENDVRTLRTAATRWAKRKGMDVAPRSRGDFRKSAMAPIYGPIKEALLVGDVPRAKFLAAKFVAEQPDRKEAEKNLKASIKQSQPFRAGPYTAEEHRTDFQQWARRNLSDGDYKQTERIQERYMKTAKAINLW